MEKILYMVAIDRDGHFVLRDTTYRPGILNLLRELEIPEVNNGPSDSELYGMDHDKWKKFLRGFVQGGRIELVEVTA